MRQPTLIKPLARDVINGRRAMLSMNVGSPAFVLLVWPPVLNVDGYPAAPHRRSEASEVAAPPLH